MSIESATPYLFFFGRAHEAIALYERSIGAKVKDKRLFGAMAKPGSPWADKVMHCELQLGDAVIFLSDGMNVPAPTVPHVNLAVALQFGVRADAHRIYDALAEKGTIEEKIFEAPWGGIFGALRDELGVSWMFTAP